jgi:YidC/Oxa1 family membrane protein insertase
MDKRLPLAMLLSLAVWFIWLQLFPPPAREEAPRLDTSRFEAPLDAGSDIGPPTGAAGEVSLEVASLPGRDVAAEQRIETMVIRGGANGIVGSGDSPEDGGLWRAIFDNRGGRLIELRTGHYGDKLGLSDEELANPEHWPVLLSAVETQARGFGGTTGSLLLETAISSKDLAKEPLSEALWNMEVLGTKAAPTGVEFSLAPGTGVRFVKRFEVANDSVSGWEFLLTLSIENQNGVNAGPRLFGFTPAACVPPALADRFYVEPRGVAVGPAGQAEPSIDDAHMRASGANLAGPLEVAPPLDYVGAHNKYFAFLMRGSDEASTASLAGSNFRRFAERGQTDTNWVVADAVLELAVPAEGETRSWTYRVYAGPKDPDIFKADHATFSVVIEEDLDWFSSIGKILLGILRAIEKVTGNFGWAIIILTFGIRGLLFPLNRRSQTSMARYQKKMKRVQPKIDAIKAKFANDRQAQTREQQKLMQEEGIFPPLGGCLPIFVQMPVFFGLFSALRTSFDLRQAPFMGYIQDLSRPDALVNFDSTTSIPLMGDVSSFNLLPIIMVVMWVLQQATMPKPADEQAAKMQRIMMFMPVMMGFFLYNYAAGLSLYMITQSTLGIFEQKVIKKVWPVDDAEPDKPKKGCGPFSGVMEKLAEKQKEQMKLMEAQKAMQAKKKGKR